MPGYGEPVMDNTEAIIRLAWARHLGLPDAHLEDGGRILVPDASRLSLIRLWDTTIVAGPEWFLTDSRLWEFDPPALVDTARRRGHRAARERSAVAFAFCDDYVGEPDDLKVQVSDDRQSLAEVEARCPADEVADSGLVGADAVFVTVTADGGPLAASGYRTREGLIAQVGVLTPPALRRRGYGLVAACLAANDAMDCGLVPLWSPRLTDPVAARMGDRIGFVTVGGQVSVGL